jgi:YgiT-type zinc finger domain-containing protein
MFKCYACGGNSARSELVSEVFILERGRRALLEGIPAQVCVHCGEATFSRETIEWIRRLLNDAGHLGDAGRSAGAPPAHPASRNALV